MDPTTALVGICALIFLGAEFVSVRYNENIRRWAHLNLDRLTRHCRFR